jgi:hypothetical protein
MKTKKIAQRTARVLWRSGRFELARRSWSTYGMQFFQPHPIALMMLVHDGRYEFFRHSDRGFYRGSSC